MSENQQKTANVLLDLINQVNEGLRVAFTIGLKIGISTDYTWPTKEASERSRPLVFLDYKAENGEILAQTVNLKHVKSPWGVCDHIFGKVTEFRGNIFNAKSYEQCSKCGTKRFYVYPDAEVDSN